MDQKAQDLANEFLKSNQGTYVKSWNITQNGQQTGEEVVVIVKRVKKPFVESFTKSVERYIPTSSGDQCPTCKGTGRV